MVNKLVIITHLMVLKFYTRNQPIMSNLLYALAVILIIIWAAGFFVYSAGSLIHILLVIAIVAVLLRVIKGKNPI